MYYIIVSQSWRGIKTSALLHLECICGIQKLPLDTHVKRRVARVRDNSEGSLWPHLVQIPGTLDGAHHVVPPLNYHGGDVTDPLDTGRIQDGILLREKAIVDELQMAYVWGWGGRWGLTEKPRVQGGNPTKKSTERYTRPRVIPLT